MNNVEPCSEAKVSMIEGVTQLSMVQCFGAPFNQGDRRFHVAGKIQISCCMKYDVLLRASQLEIHQQDANNLLFFAQASKIERLQFGLGRHGWCGAVVLGRARRHGAEQ